MTELEKKAYAYVIDRQKDPNFPVYNWETEITDAYEQGYKDAIDKFCLYMENCKGYVVNGSKCNYDSFIKFMEEQL